MAHLEASIQGPIGIIIEDFPRKLIGLKWNGTRRKEIHHKAFVEQFIKKHFKDIEL